MAHRADERASGGGDFGVARRVEPLPSGHPFWHHPRIMLTPHASAVTLVEDAALQVAAKIRRLERGESVTGTVDRARGY
jgi:glyoxylate/hydroxypyruvate reductase